MPSHDKTKPDRPKPTRLICSESLMGGDLREPKSNFSLGFCSAPTAIMSMPKAAVDEHRPLMGAVRNVWAAWQIERTNAVTHPHRADYATNRLLGERIAPANASHSVRYRR